MTAEFDAISLQTAQLLLLYQSVKVEKTRHGSPQETPNNMAIRDVEFSNGGYKIRKIFA